MRLSYPIGSIMLINRDLKELSNNRRIIRNLHITYNLLQYSSAKDAYDNLELFSNMAGQNYPDLVIFDHQEDYQLQGKFLDRALTLFPEKGKRPLFILMWDGPVFPGHPLVDYYIGKDRLEQTLGELFMGK